MLKSITLENYVHFKDKIVIDFDTSWRVKQSRESLPEEITTSNASADEIERGDARNEETADCNALNIFVGANFCGKSAVLELIRRCMTDEINVSVTSSFDKNLNAYVFCQFSFSPFEEVISGNIKEPGNDVMYKVLIYSYKNDTFLRWKSSINETTHNGMVHKDDMQAIRSILNNKSNGTITHLLNIIKTLDPLDYIPVNLSWKIIENKYLSTLPLRGIGMVQWTKSDKIGKDHKEHNYETASERAEVISTLLFGDHRNDVDGEFGDNIFDFITYPEKFQFKKKGKELYVQHNGSEFPLLKTSEGVLEAKLTSLLLAHKHIQTLCLEDPDRGMHPQMIERLRTVLHREAYKKTIIVVTHSPYFIDTITVQNTYVFFRKKTSYSYVCSVKNAGKSKELSNVSDIETLRTLLFATKVLLVEGPTDREVVQGIFTQYKHNMLQKEANEKEKNGGKEVHVNKKDDFQIDITTFQVIPVGGCENMKNVQKFCRYINLPCVCLLDLDKVVKCKDITLNNVRTKVISNFLEIDSSERFSNNYRDKEPCFFIAHEDSLKVAKSLESNRNTFIWRHGAVEDAVLSCPNRINDICDSLNCETLTVKDLKKKLKERLNEKQRKAFYFHVMKVDEIRRFITFMEEKEQCLCKRKMNASKSYIFSLFRLVGWTIIVCNRILTYIS